MSAKPCLVLLAAWSETRTGADELAIRLEAAAGGEEAPAVASVHPAETLDLPGIARMLGRFGIDGVVPEDGGAEPPPEPPPASPPEAEAPPA